MWLHAVGWALLHLLWQGAAVAVLARLAFGAAGPRPVLRYRIALTALGLLMMLPVATTVVLRVATPTVEPAPPAPPPPELSAVAPEAPEVVTTWLLGMYATVGPIVPWVLGIWAAGVVLLAVRWLGGWWLTRRLVKRATRAPPFGWTRATDRLARALGLTRPVRLLEATRVDVPAVVDGRHPAILVPAFVFRELRRDQVEAVIAHELAHVRRRDHLANLFQMLVETVLFFHPVVWWVSRWARVEREQCCDDLVLGLSVRPVTYARALARLEEIRGGPHRVAFAASGGALLERIRRIAGGREVSVRRRGRTGAVAATVGGLALLAVGCGVLVPPTAALFVDPSVVIHAQDPAGPFTVTLVGGRVVDATIDGVAVPDGRLRQDGRDVWFLTDVGQPSFSIRVHRDGRGIRWDARPAHPLN